MEASLGRCFSKASLSGALTEVCPETIAPTFVAGNRYQRKWEEDKERCVRDNGRRKKLDLAFLLELTRPVSSDYAVEKGSFYRVYYQITYPGNEMTISEDFEFGI